MMGTIYSVHEKNCVLAADVLRSIRVGSPQEMESDWQDWSGKRLHYCGEREIQRALRHILYVKYEMKDQDLFDKAYGYIAQYY
jgi:hypothetical protein